LIANAGQSAIDAKSQELVSMKHPIGRLGTLGEAAANTGV